MPNPVPGREAVDLGDGTAATFYDDGSVSVWNISTGQEVTYQGPTMGGAVPGGGQGQGGSQPFVGYNQWGGTVAPSTPATIGAGTAGIQYGYGVPGFGQPQIPIRQEYLPYLQSAPGYIPGSGTYNQFRLDQPGLLTTINGQQVNARYGQGGTGDPTTGQEPRTPEEWLNAPQAFSWQYNMGQTPETRGLDYIANLFGRPDAGTSGISTAAWSAPQVYWEGLADAVRRGVVQATPTGLAALRAKGLNVQPPGGAAGAPGGAAGAPGGAGQGQGAPGGSGFGQGSYSDPDLLNAMTNAAQVAYQRTYHEWLARSGDERLAIERARQAADAAYQEAQVGVQAAGLMASLQGPANQFRAVDALYGLNQAGVSNAVSALAGQFEAPRTQGLQALPQGATLQTVAQQLAGAGQGGPDDIGAQARAFQAGLPAPQQIVGRQFAGLTPGAQQLTLAAYSDLGYNPEDVLNTIQQNLPQFQAPRMGAVM